MSDLFSQLGIEWKIILAQIVNFTILLFVLTKFVYKPIIKLLNERKRKVEEDIKARQELTQKFDQIEKEREHILSEARKKSQEIIKQSEKSATEIKERIMSETREEVERLKVESRKQMEMEKSKLTESLKGELKGLITKAVEKVLFTKNQTLDHKKFIDEIISSSNNKNF